MATTRKPSTSWPRPPAAYVGLIGSRRKIRLIFESLREAGISEADLERVTAPVGPGDRLAVGARDRDQHRGRADRPPQPGPAGRDAPFSWRVTGSATGRHSCRGRRREPDMIAALVPAAGSSSRMGRPKLLLEFDGQTLDRPGRDGRSAQGGAGRVVVVAPPADAAEGPAIAAEADAPAAEVVVPLTRPAADARFDRAGTGEAGIGELPRSVVLLTPGDYPGITAEMVAQLVDSRPACRTASSFPAHNGRRGHPIVLPWTIAASDPFAARGRRRQRTGGPARGLGCRDGGRERRSSSPTSTRRTTCEASGRATDQNVRSRVSPSRERFRVQVRLFALAKDRAGRSELEIELARGSKVADLRAALGRATAGARAHCCPTVMIAVDEEYAGDDAPICPARGWP